MLVNHLMEHSHIIVENHLNINKNNLKKLLIEIGVEDGEKII